MRVRKTIQPSYKEEVYNRHHSFLLAKWADMCEFKVILNGETVFKDAVLAKLKGGNVTVTDVLGQSKEFKNCKILEVNVNSTRLVLSSS